MGREDVLLPLGRKEDEGDPAMVREETF